MAEPQRTILGMITDRKTTLRAAAGYLAILLALFHRLWLGEVLSPAVNLWVEVPFRGELPLDLSQYLNGVQGDVWRAFEPWHDYQHRAAADGRFPLWNPHSFCGFPFHANAQASMLSPFHWPYFVVDPRWAHGPVAAAKLWVAGMATFALGRQLAMAPLAAFLSGVAWMLSAYMVRWLGWSQAAVGAWLPVVFWTLERYLQGPNLRRLAEGGLAATALQLGGHPETQFHVGVLAGLFVLGRVAADRRRPLVRLVGCLLIQVLGFAGAAVALLPFLAEMIGSADWAEATHAHRRALPLRSFVALLSPDHFGRPRSGMFYEGPFNYNEAGLFIGIVPLAFALVACASTVRKPRHAIRGDGNAIATLSAIAGLCAAIIFGLPGVDRVLDHLPVFSKADNLRLVLGLQFTLCLLAGFGWTELTRGGNRTRAGWLVAVFAAAAVLLFATLALAHREGLMRFWIDPRAISTSAGAAVRTVASLAVALLGGGLAMWWRHALPRTDTVGRHPNDLSSTPIAARRPAHLLVALATAELLFVAYDFTPTVPARYIFPAPPPSLTWLAKSAGDGRIVASDEILSPNVAMVYGLRDLRGYDFPLDRHWANLLRRLDWRVGNVHVPRSDFLPFIRPAVRSVLDKCSVRFAVLNTYRSHLPAFDGPAGSPEEGASALPWPCVRRGAAGEAIYANPAPYPRAYLAAAWSWGAPNVALDAVLNPAHDFRQLSYIDDEQAESAAAVPQKPAEAITVATGRVAATGDKRRVGSARLVSDAPERIEIESDATDSGLLVLADRYDSAWRVRIDGRPAESLRANYLFRGVQVPSGRHTVVWTYEPASFAWGVGVTLIAYAVLIGCWWRGRRSTSAGDAVKEPASRHHS